MSTKHTCTTCNHPIPTGLAVLRSQSFQLVAYCQPCARERGIESPALLPAFRVAS